MKVTLSIEYHTAWGESLTMVAGDVRFPMEWKGDDIWSVTIPSCTASLLSDYGYILEKDGIILRTEWKRHSSKPKREIRDHWQDCTIPGCPFPREHSAALFDRPGFRGAGTLVPVFSLRTEDDFGIGDFRDLHPLIDWAASTGQCLIQLLPVNDTTRLGDWQDSYPYSPVSSFALNPMYIRLQDLGIKADAAFHKVQAALNALEEIDYPAVYKAKTAFMRKAFEMRGLKDLESAAYRKFALRNESWLGEYAEFCSKRDHDAPEFHSWVQFHLDRQFSDEVSYAHSKGVYLKGDLPIGVSADSADAFYHPGLFNLDSTAGAPPDYFSSEGQNWFFPTYNWEKMASDGYAWWKARLRKMAEYFDAYRIDHILGFFRIWEIPLEFKSGKDGHFNPALPYSKEEITELGIPLEGLFHEDPRHPGMYQPYISPDTDKLSPYEKARFGGLYNDFFYNRHNDFWKLNAEKKLPELLSSTGMLACGEDLGMAPACVPEVMSREKILSLRVRGMGGDFGYFSVCATSNHDMPTLRMQFKDDPCAEECRRVLEEFLALPSMLAVFPLQDWLSMDARLRRADRMAEKINEPANSRHHWSYRVHFPLEKLNSLEAKTFRSEVFRMLENSSRCNN